jgi:cyanate lyase
MSKKAAAVKVAEQSKSAGDLTESEHDYVIEKAKEILEMQIRYDKIVSMMHKIGIDFKELAARAGMPERLLTDLIYGRRQWRMNTMLAVRNALSKESAIDELFE